MRQLSGLDSTFLHFDRDNQFGHIAGLSVFERPATGDYDPYRAWRNQLAARLDALEPLRRRLREVPFGLDHPFWVDDPEFNLSFHVRSEQLHTGDDADLAALVADLISRPLDLRRPLWESYVIDGLHGGRFAILTKLHHATIDGSAGVELLTLMLDDTATAPAPEPAPAWTPKRLPNDVEVLAAAAATMARKPIKAAFLAVQLVRGLAVSARNPVMAAAASQLLNGLRDFALQRRTEASDGPLPRLNAPPTPFNGPITARRQFAFGSVPLSMVKAVKEHFGATVNDIVLAACAGGLRSWLASQEALPEEPLVAVVPVASKRTVDDRWTNRVSVAIVSLPTNVPDRAARVDDVHDSMDRAKQLFDAVPADALTDFATFPPPAVFALAMRASNRWARARRMPVNLVVSNVPGPRHALFAAGARLQHYYPVSTIMEGTGLNITVHSYRDSLDFGLVSCPDLVPDVDEVLAAVLAELAALADEAGVNQILEHEAIGGR